MTELFRWYRDYLGARHSLPVILSLALGMAGATGVLSVVSNTPLIGLHIGGAELVWLMAEYPELGLRTSPEQQVFEAWRRELHCCENLEAFWLEESGIRTDSGAQPVRTAYISPGFLDLMGAGTTVGPGFDSRSYSTAQDVAILRRGLARSLFGSEEAALGETVRIDGLPLAVVGVVPEGVGRPAHLYEEIDVLRPMVGNRGEPVQVLARLREGFSVASTQHELDAWSAAHRSDLGDENARWVVLPETEMLATKTRDILEVALIAGLVLVLVTASNVTHLLAARAASERRDLATRQALGAARRSILKRKAAEVFIWTAFASLVAAALTSAGLEVLTAMVPEELQFLEAARLQGGPAFLAAALTFSLVISAVGLPSLLSSSRRLVEDLRGNPRFGRRSSLGRLFGQVHVVTVVAASVALAVASWLVIEALIQVSRADVGFDMARLQVVEVTLPETKYEQRETRRAVVERLLDRVSSIPAVESAAVSSPAPLEPGIYMGHLQFGGAPPGAATPPGIGLAAVGPGYFRTLRQRIVAGREFVVDDLEQGAAVAVISTAAANHFGRHPGDAVGELIRFGADPRRVVGVVADVQSPGSPLPFGPSTAYWPLVNPHPATTVMVRGSDELLPLVREVANEIDPDIVVQGSAMEARFARSLARIRFLRALFSLLAALAFGLAVLGVFCVLSNSVVQERAQIALRLALGASRREVRVWMVERALSRCVLGIALGIAASYPLGRLLSQQLYGVEPDGLKARIFAALVVLVASAIATWLPTSRTSRVDPGEVLKSC